MIPSKEIQALFERHGLDGPVPTGLTLKKVVQEPVFGSLKLRAFPNGPIAEERLHYLDVCRGIGIQAPQVLGHYDRFVIFEFAPVDKAELEPKSLREIGCFLGRLNTIPTEPIEPTEFFGEVEDWLKSINQENILPPKLTFHILEELQKLLPVGIATGIDYWDAMPHNFGWQTDTFYMLDEKHTRHSFCGVGLVKPMLVLSEPEWAYVRAGYSETAELKAFENNKPFLVYYYLLAALYFYSLISAAGRIDPSRNTRLQHYRTLLLGQTSNLPRTSRILADLKFILSYPRSLPMMLRPIIRPHHSSNRAK